MVVVSSCGAPNPSTNCALDTRFRSQNKIGNGNDPVAKAFCPAERQKTNLPSAQTGQFRTIRKWPIDLPGDKEPERHIKSELTLSRTSRGNPMAHRMVEKQNL